MSAGGDLQEHRDVFEAIRARDPVEPYRAVRVLLDHADQDVMASMAVST